MIKREKNLGSFPAKGFEQVPQGRLLRQTIELDSEMGIAYERSVGFVKEMHNHDRFMIVCPRGTCRMVVTSFLTKQLFEITSTDVLLVPKAAKHDDRSLSTIYDTLALYPSHQFLDQLISENGLSESDKNILLGNITKIKRTRWLDDLIERYFFERVINQNSPLGCTFFLEKQILNEIARIVFKNKLRHLGGNPASEPNSLAEEVLSFIEGNLFENIGLEKLAESLKSSPSTLQRAFKQSFQQTIGSYVKSRRLDEAYALLQKNDHSIGDIALLVGYEDLSAFTRAFKNKFQKLPSKI